MRSVFSLKALDSRIHGGNTRKSEQIIGYFLGPCLVCVMYSGVAGTYLTQFYTDVLGLGGSLLTMMPLISKIISSFVGVVIGRMIDRTRTSQGKARPWLLASGVLLALCGILLYVVPCASYEIQLVWVVVSYNLFFSLAFSVYSLSHSLMVPLSTRNTRQRDNLAMLTSTGTVMIPGVLVTIIMPLLVKTIGVGSNAKSSWITVMGILSIVAIPAALMEYYFTKERVTAESLEKTEITVSFGEQISACFRDRCWVMVIIFTAVLNLCSGLSSNSMLYYCNWVLGSSVENGAAKQILVNVIGHAPMGLGVVILWPLVHKFGKCRVTIAGFSIAAVGSFAVVMAGNNIIAVLGGLLIKSTGSLPVYVMAALLAETLDHIEQTKGIRADGFSSSVNNIVQTVALGLAQTFLLGGINIFGYIIPESTIQNITQSEAIRNFFIWCFAGVPMLGYVVCSVIMIFYYKFLKGTV